jgi:subfamily B ATP-binding cassette protein MsbA
LLGTIFGLFSFLTVIPLLEILFSTDSIVYQIRKITVTFSDLKELRDTLVNNLYALVQNLSADYGALKTLIFIGMFFIFMVLFKTGFNYLGSLMMVYIRNYVVRDVRNLLYSKVVALPIGFFTEERKGDIIARITGDVTEIENSIMTSLDMFFKNPIIIIITVTAMIFMSWQLTVFVFVLFPVAGALIGIIGKRLRQASLKSQTKMGEILSTIEETLGGLRIIKAFNAEKIMRVLQQRQNQDYRNTQNKVMSRQQLASPLSEFLGTVVIVTVMIYGGSLILTENEIMLKPSIFIAYIVFFYSIIQPTKAFSSAFYNIQKGLASMERIDRILYTENPIVNIADPRSISKISEAVEYRNVWFRYGDEYVLKNIDLKINRGQTVALVGQSGSGKSTLVDLMPRFYDVEKGSIVIDNINIREFRINELRNLFGIVNQEPILFNDTVFNNIAFGNENTTEEEVIRAAKIANAHEFILATENGYQTNIGDRGSKLSGGQRQRISIARAILRNPSILILDEATSALDTESERLVQQAIDNLMKHRTSIVIAHRLSTIRNVDWIFVLHEGQIIEQGGYKQLLDLNGEFKKLHNNQFH